jgi:hypothetical protein
MATVKRTEVLAVQKPAKAPAAELLGSLRQPRCAFSRFNLFGDSAAM